MRLMKWLTIFIMKVHLDTMTWMKFEGLMHPTLNTNLMLMVLDSARRGEGLYKRIFSSLSGSTVSAVRMAAVQWRYKDFNVLSILLLPWGQAKEELIPNHYFYSSRTKQNMNSHLDASLVVCIFSES